MRLISVALHLTYVCANRCRFCYVGDLRQESHPALSDVQSVIAALSRGGVQDVLLVGGDPCTYPFLRDVVDQAYESGLQTQILSNTLDFGADLTFFIKRITAFQTTILGMNEERHDQEAARPGAYARLIRNIRALNHAGRSVDILFTLHHANAATIEKMVDNLVRREKLAIGKLVIQRMIPWGYAADGSTPAMVPQDVPLVFAAVHNIRKRYGLPIDFEDPFPLCLVPPEHRYLQTHPCLWGITCCSVNSSGDMSRCGADPRLTLGNLHAVANLQTFWNENERLQKFRAGGALHDHCRACPLLPNCGGGCSLSACTEADYTCDVLLH